MEAADVFENSDEESETEIQDESVEDCYNAPEIDKEELEDALKLNDEDEDPEMPDEEIVEQKGKKGKKKKGGEEKKKKTAAEMAGIYSREKNYEEVVNGSEVDDETKALYAELGNFLVKRADIVHDSGQKLIIPTGIKILDAMLGGGVAIGAICCITGNPGCGKSMLAAQIMANAQQIYKGALCGYLDSECSTTTVRLANLGVRFPKIVPFDTITIETVFKYIDALHIFKTEKNIDIPSVVIWDSVANTLSVREQEATDDVNSVMGYKARLLSYLIPKYLPKINTAQICLIAVNQLRDQIQIGNFKPAKELRFLSANHVSPGGKSILFNAFQFLELKAGTSLIAKTHGFNGIMVEVRVVKNKIGSPNVSVPIAGNFKTGFNSFWSSLFFMAEKKYIRAAAWYQLTNYSKNFRIADAEGLYKTDPGFKTAFDELEATCIQKEIIEKI